MDWREAGTVLSVRRHGESAAIIEVFTREHGRHAGVVRGGGGRKMAPILQPGAVLDLSWRARLEEHIGAFTVEPLRARSAAILGDRLALAGLNAVCALLHFVLPERAPYPGLYERTETVLDLMVSSEAWPLAYLRWELALLDEMGVGLDLSRCAATGAIDDLIYVSPRTGRAVSKAGAGEWADRMLPLPPALMGHGHGDPAEIVQGMKTTGYFLEHKLAHQLGDKPLPEARRRLMDLLARR